MILIKRSLLFNNENLLHTIAKIPFGYFKCKWLNILTRETESQIQHLSPLWLYQISLHDMIRESVLHTDFPEHVLCSDGEPGQTAPLSQWQFDMGLLFYFVIRIRLREFCVYNNIGSKLENMNVQSGLRLCCLHLPTSKQGLLMACFMWFQNALHYTDHNI